MTQTTIKIVRATVCDLHVVQPGDVVTTDAGTARRLIAYGKAVPAPVEEDADLRTATKPAAKRTATTRTRKPRKPRS